MEEELDALAAKTRESEERRLRRAAIVGERVMEFATRMGEDFAELTPIGSTRYFAVGDVVLSVRPHGIIDKDKTLTTKQREVLWQYTVALIGVDIIGSVYEVGRGTLLMLDYASISKACIEGGKRSLEFELSRVIAALYPTSN